jgi:lipoprotein-anchoring transpeptidase ErfK/SrfK
VRSASALALSLVVLASGMLAQASHAAESKGSVSVAFLRGEQLAPVLRPGKTPRDAIRALIAGPTAAERSRGFRTYVAPGTKLRRLSVAGTLATVDFNGAFTSGTGERRAARVAQVVRTLTGLDGIKRVQLLVNGALPLGLVKGISLGRPITLHLLRTPNVSVPVPPQPRLPAPDPATKKLQQQLIALGYLLHGDDDGRFGPATSDAILTFQKWEGLTRTGMIDGRTRARLATAERPTPASKGSTGKRAEVLLDKQVTLLISNGRVVRAISVSTGKPTTPTPPGNYHVYAKIPRWWSVPFREWLPWALPFVGGIAFHQFQVVPTYPASHGCVRQLPTVAQWTYGFAYVGMPVKVIATS